MGRQPHRFGRRHGSDKVQADWLVASSIGRNTLLLWTSAGSVVGGNIKPTAVPDFFSLGGFFNFSGLAPTSLFGPNYAITRAIYFRKIGRGGEGFFEFPAYIGMSLENGQYLADARRHEFWIDAQGRVPVPCVRYLSWARLPGFGLRRRRPQRLLPVPRQNFLSAAALHSTAPKRPRPLRAPGRGESRRRA